MKKGIFKTELFNKGKILEAFVNLENRAEDFKDENEINEHDTLVEAMCNSTGFDEKQGEGSYVERLYDCKEFKVFYACDTDGDDEWGIALAKWEE